MTAIVRTVEVALPPARAFEVFTAEIGEWYRSGSYSWNDPARAVGIRLEPGVGGRLLELYEDGGPPFEMGRVTAWEPGERLVFDYRTLFLPAGRESEIEVRFEPTAAGTRVRLEHRGLPPAIADRWQVHAWKGLMRWYAEHAGGAR